jgi:hypothetical protein
MGLPDGLRMKRVSGEDKPPLGGPARELTPIICTGDQPFGSRTCDHEGRLGPVMLSQHYPFAWQRGPAETEALKWVSC